MSKYLSLVIATLVFVVAALGYGYIYLDIVSAIDSIGSARTQIAAIGSRDSFAKSAALFLSETGTERARMQNFITGADQTANAIEIVEAAARLAGVKAVVSSAEIKPLPQTHFESLVVTVGATGSFVNQANFATVLESLPKGATLSSAHLEVAEKGWYSVYTLSFIKEKSL